jgi:hypothetical protein
MSTAIELLADPADAELAGRPAPAGDAPSAPTGDAPLIALSDATSAGRRPLVRWLDRPARPEDRDAELVIAPAGEGLWRRAPWPAADALFELAPASPASASAGPSSPASASAEAASPASASAEAASPASASPALLVGGERGLRDAVAARAAERGVALRQAERLDAAALGGVGCVVMAESPGGALPARGFAVLAAGRLLITPRLETTFGLEDGLDHLEFASPDEALDAVRAFGAAPATFGRVLSWGRLKAEQQRASVVYARLADDLRLQGLVSGA